MKEEISKKDLEEVLNYCEPQEKAILLLMYSSGMSVDEICHLEYFDFFLSVNEYFEGTKTGPFYLDEILAKLRSREDLIGTWEIFNKRDIPYVTFSSTQSIHAIMDCLYLRKGYCYMKLNEPLFVGKNGKKIKKEDIEAMFKRLRYETAMDISPLNLRILFVETLSSENTRMENVMDCLSHEFNPIITEWMKSDIETVKADYLKVASEFNLNKVSLLFTIDEYLLLLDEIRDGDYYV